MYIKKNIFKLDELVKQLKEKTNIVDIIREHTRVYPGNYNYFYGDLYWSAACFMDEEDSDPEHEIFINQERQDFYCDTCNRKSTLGIIGGDIIDYIMQLYKCDFHEAIYILSITSHFSIVEQLKLRKLYDLDQQIERLYSLKKNWDSYDADLPNHFAIKRLVDVLNIWINVYDLIPAKVAPSVMNGCGIVFVCDKNRYADIEFFNDGTCGAIFSYKGKEPIAWDIDMDLDGEAIKESLNRIRDFINGEYEI